MIYQRLTALFARYCSAHLCVMGEPMPFVGMYGQTVGHVDRVYRQGPRLIVEGWADCHKISLTYEGQTHECFPSLMRHDVAGAHPNIAAPNPGFAIDLAYDFGPVTLCLMRDGEHLVYRLNGPNERAVRQARARLVLLFLRDMASAAPAILHWLLTKDPADRARLKRHLRLVAPAPSQAMQPLLFLADSLAQMPAKQRDAELSRLQTAALGHRAITIVLPTYNAFDLLPDVLDRVVRHTDLPWRLILIEDASTDPALRPYLRAWVRAQKADHSGRITLIENAENQGFIRSVNAGLRLALGYGDHVVLLNSDAFVPQGWASRLMRPFLAHDRVATVTPMSNDAEIFTAPVICQRSAFSPGEADAIDAVAAKLHPDAALADAPTGVGFCMAMSIDYLRKLPQLDTVFGRGYGEEVDWCQKARALGGRHLGLANLFVEHRGGTSFGQPEKQRLVARNGAVVSRRYPSYDSDVQRFIAHDPLSASRLVLAIAWAAGRAVDAVPLYIAHSLGGGAEDYLAQRIARSLPQAALVLRVGGSCRWQLELHTAHGVTRGGTDSVALIQRLIDPVVQLRIIYSCAVGDTDPADLPSAILALRRGGQDRVEMLIHDYFPISPSYTLLNRSGRFDGLPDPRAGDQAHISRRPNGAVVRVADWQAEWGKLVSAAEEITAFSKNSAQIFAAAYPEAEPKMQITPHQPLVDLPHAKPTAGRQRVIGVLGNIGHPKGAAVLQELSKWLDSTTAAKLVVLGRLDPAYPLTTSAVVLGGYLRVDIPALITRYGITDWLIPSIWPETFSYTTHEAIATGLPVWGFDLGAQGSALRAASQGKILPIPGGVPDLGPLFSALAPAQSQIQTESATA